MLCQHTRDRVLSNDLKRWHATGYFGLNLRRLEMWSNAVSTIWTLFTIKTKTREEQWNKMENKLNANQKHIKLNTVPNLISLRVRIYFAWLTHWLKNYIADLTNETSFTKLAFILEKYLMLTNYICKAYILCTLSCTIISQHYFPLCPKMNLLSIIFTVYLATAFISS